MRFKLLATLLVTGLLATQVMAQSIVTGDIVGTITDPSNAVVSGATVTLSSPSTGSSTTTTTNSTGFFRFALVKPGSYKISVTQSGFRTSSALVSADIGKVNTANLQLQVGQGSETVEVSGAAPLIQTEDANLSTSYSQQQLATLPAPGGDITSYAYTAPGIVVNTGAGYGNFSAFGLPSTANLFTTNGNDEMDPFLNLNNSGASNLLMGSNELQEIAVVNNGYTAQYGRQAGTQMNAATKSGSNSLHGNAVFNYNSSILNANDWFTNATAVAGQPAPGRPKAVNRQWAASLGGPIVKDKLFFFVDQEGLRMVLPGVSGPVFIPTTAFANFVSANVPAAAAPFYNNMFSLYAGAVGAAGATNVTDATGGCGDFSGTAGFGANGIPCAKSFNSSATNLITEWILAGRVDYKINSADTLFGRYKMDRGVQATGTDPINPVFNATSIQPQYEGQLNETHIFNNTTINNLIISGTWYKALFGPSNFNQAVATFPTDVSFADGEPFQQLAPTFGYPQGRIVTQYQIADDFSKSMGGHDLKVGINFRRNLVSDYSALASTAGLLAVNSMTEFANGVIDPVAPASFYEQSFDNVGAVQIKLYSLGLYAQDQWKVTSKLNLTLALRVDRNSNPVCSSDCFSRMIGPFESVTHDVNVPYNQTIQTGQKNAFSNVEKAVMSPRFGMAYNIRPNTVLRGGFGIFDDLFPTTLVDRFITNAPNVNLIVTGDPGASLAVGGANNVYATAAAQNATFNSQFNSGLTTAVLGGTLPFYTMENKLQNPKFAEWNLELQQQVGSKYSVGLNYAGNHGYDIMTIDPWQNAACIACNPGQTFGGQIGTTPTDPRFGEIVDLTNNGWSNYQGVTASFKVKSIHGFSGQFNYTYSHDLDTCSNNCVEPFVANTNVSLRYQTSPLLPGTAYGNSDYDVRHNFNLNYVYETPSNWSNSILKNLLGGWVLGQTMFFHTGLGWSPVDVSSRGGLENVVGLRNATPLATYAGAVPSPSCGTAAAQAGAQIGGAACLDISQFAPGTLGFGNASRNSQRGPSFFDSDVSLTKNFNVTERIRLGIGANFFDIFNHQNFDLPFNSVTNGAFGSILSTIGTNTNPYGAFFGVPLNGRIVQVNAKVTF